MKKRVFSAIVMVGLFIPFLLLGGLPFEIFMTALAVVGLYELINIREINKKFPLIVKIFAYLMVIFLVVSNLNQLDFNIKLDYRLMSFVIFAFLTPLVFINNNKKYNLDDAVYLVASVLFVGLSFNLLVITRNYELSYIIYLLLITTITDTFALFTGMLIGKHKLAPEISPKKTIEGAIGGSLMGTFVATAFYITVINSSISLVLVIFITALLSVVGQLGDLIFSSIKRYYGKKDFSDLIPGHGGILDRFDSIIFVALAFVILVGII